MGYNHTEGVAEHPDYLPDIGLEPYPVEQPSEGVKLLLQPIRICGRNQAVVHIEEGGAVKQLLPTTVRTSRTYCHQRDPVAHHCIHDHIENWWGQRVPLSDPPKTSERLSVIPTRASHHCQPTPITTEDASSPRPHFSPL